MTPAAACEPAELVVVCGALVGALVGVAVATHFPARRPWPRLRIRWRRGARDK